MSKYKGVINKEFGFLALCLLGIALLIMLPTGFEKQIYRNAEHVKVRVIETNESGVYTSGSLKLGSQVCEVEVLSGTFKGEVIEIGRAHV